MKGEDTVRIGVKQRKSKSNVNRLTPFVSLSDVLTLLFRFPKNAAGFKCLSNKLPCHPRYGSVVFFSEVLDD